MGPAPATVTDVSLINASMEPVRLIPGAALFNHVLSSCCRLFRRRRKHRQLAHIPSVVLQDHRRLQLSRHLLEAVE